jgi:hypothetical protein
MRAPTCRVRRSRGFAHCLVDTSWTRHRCVVPRRAAVPCTGVAQRARSGRRVPCVCPILWCVRACACVPGCGALRCAAGAAQRSEWVVLVWCRAGMRAGMPCDVICDEGVMRARVLMPAGPVHNHMTDTPRLDALTVEIFHRKYKRCCDAELASDADAARSCGCPNARPPCHVRLNNVLPVINRAGGTDITNHLNPGKQKRGTAVLQRTLAAAGVPAPPSKSERPKSMVSP